jgi:hypothetical protein
MNLEDKDGLPWTASMGLGWIVLLLVLTVGIAYTALSIYLALWICTKGRSAMPLVCFSIITLLEFLCIPLAHTHWFATIADPLAILSTILWIGATFYLRNEIMTYYRKSEGWDISIGPWLTLMFSTPYINYCLNPITISDGRNTFTSLNLDSSPSKIAR